MRAIEDFSQEEKNTLFAEVYESVKSYFDKFVVEEWGDGDDICEHEGEIVETCVSKILTEEEKILFDSIRFDEDNT